MVDEGTGEGFELALPGDTIRKRHIATRASNRRRIIVLVVGDSEFEGYSIGLDGHSLQLLELPSGDVSTIALEHIVAITDGKPFVELTRADKDIVDQRTSSFRKTSSAWLVKRWPETYDHRDDDGGPPNRQRFNYRRPPRPFSAYNQMPSDDHEATEERTSSGDSEVRN